MEPKGIFRDSHSTEVQEIIGRIPSWITRRGNILIALTFLLIFGCLWFVKYPEVVKVKVLTTSSIPSTYCSAPSAGQIKWVNIKDGDFVKKSQLIAYFPDHISLVDLKEVKNVLVYLQKMVRGNSVCDTLNISSNLKIGSMQPIYKSILKNINYCNYNKTRAEKILYPANVKNDLSILATMITDIENRFTMRSPKDGYISNNDIWKTDNYVKKDEVVFSVAPVTDTYNCWALVPINDIGKINLGQKSLVTLNEYPLNKFGFFQAEVESISNVPADNTYTVKLRFTKRLQISKNKRIIRPKMSGSADIIIRDENLIQRLLHY
jgi:hypothetical protein